MRTVGPHSGSELGAGLYSVHAGCFMWTGIWPPTWIDGDGLGLVAVGFWQVVQGQGPFYLVGRSWVTWRRRLGVAPAVPFLGLVVVVPVVQVVLRAGGSGRFLAAALRPVVDVLGGMLVAEGLGGGRRF